jgi:hypothetical protein
VSIRFSISGYSLFVLVGIAADGLDGSRPCLCARWTAENAEPAVLRYRRDDVIRHEAGAGAAKRKGGGRLALALLTEEPDDISVHRDGTRVQGQIPAEVQKHAEYDAEKRQVEIAERFVVFRMDDDSVQRFDSERPEHGPGERHRVAVELD